MEDTQYVVEWGDTITLSFEGAQIVSAYHTCPEEGDEIELDFGEGWFQGADDEEYRIELQMAPFHPYDEDPVRLANITINGEIVKILEIAETVDGEFFIEPSDSDY